MALDPQFLLSKLFQWVFRSKQQLFDSATVADFMDVDEADASRALKSLAKEGKLDTHGAWFSLHGAVIESGSIPKPEPPAPIPVKAPPAKPAAKSAPEKAAKAPTASRAHWPVLDPPVYTWVIDVADALIDYVQETGKPEVSVEALDAFAGADFAETYPKEREITGRIYQVLEFFAGRGLLTRGSVPGGYLAHANLVEREQSVASKLDRMDIKRASKREYTIECAVPYTGLKGLAVMLYGGQSFIAPELTFPTPEGMDYIEVHHIQRIAQGGNESLENLALLNPFHHKWCHFSTDAEMERMERELQAMVKARLEALIAEHMGGGKGPAKKTAAKSTAKTAAKKTVAKAEAKPAAKKAAAKTAAKKSAAKPAARKAAAKAPAKKAAKKSGSR